MFETVTEGIKVLVGSTPHPMEEKHYIEWIDLICANRTYRHYLKPGQAPETVFKLSGPTSVAREYFSVHGL